MTLRTPILLTVAVTLLAAPTAFALDVTTTTQAFDSDYECRSDSWYYYNYSSDGNGSSWYYYRSTDVHSCRGEYTTVGVAAEDEDGNTLLAAEAGDESANSGHSSYTYTDSYRAGRCTNSSEGNASCTPDYYKTAQWSNGYSSSNWWSGARATLPTGGSYEASLYDCHHQEGYSSSYTTSDWNTSDNSTDYRYGHSDGWSSTSCFRGVEGNETVRGTGTAADGTSASTRAGESTTDDSACWAYGYDSPSYCTESHDERRVVAGSLTVPGVGTYSIAHSFTPAEDPLLP